MMIKFVITWLSVFESDFALRRDATLLREDRMESLKQIYYDS